MLVVLIGNEMGREETRIKEIIETYLFRLAVVERARNGRGECKDWLGWTDCTRDSRRRQGKQQLWAWPGTCVKWASSISAKLARKSLVCLCLDAGRSICLLLQEGLVGFCDREKSLEESRSRNEEKKIEFKVCVVSGEWQCRMPSWGSRKKLLGCVEK